MDNPTDPRKFLAMWASTRGNVRHFLEDTWIPPRDEQSQRIAGEAAAAAAAQTVEETYGMDIESFSSGVDSVSGSIHSAGSRYLTAFDPDIPVDPGAAAFFDVDNTLIQGSSLIELGIGMMRKKFITMSDILPFVWKQIKFRISGNENTSDMHEGRQAALSLAKDKPVDELMAAASDIVDTKMLDKTYAGTRLLAQMHLNAGQQVWLVTATPVQLAQVLARRLGFTGALGTVPEVKDGLITGRLVGDILHGPGKAHAVAALAAMENLDLSRCTAYSDSINDIPMLSMVGTAVAINPDSKLEKEARSRGWIIRDYRNMRKVVRKVGGSKFLLPGLSLAAIGMATRSWLQRLSRRD